MAPLARTDSPHSPHRPCHLPASTSSPESPCLVGVLHKKGRSDRLHAGIEWGPDGRRRGEEAQRLRLHSVGIAQGARLGE